MSSINTPYDDSFRTILTDCPRLVIPLVNEMFDEAFSLKEQVVLYQNEHFLADDEKRITDSNISIGKDEKRRFHIECESSEKEDGSIIVRVFEYAVQVSIENAESVQDKTVFKLPRSGVLYLRSRNDKIREHVIAIDTLVGEISYGVPIIRMKDYSLDEIFDKKLWFLIPFYFMNYSMLTLEKDENKRKDMVATYEDIFSRIDVLVKNEEINIYEKYMITSMCRLVALAMAGNNENVRKEVDEVMGGKVLDYEAKDILNKGKEEGTILTLLGLVKDGILSIQDAAVRAGLTEEEFNNRAKVI